MIFRIFPVVLSFYTFSYYIVELWRSYKTERYSDLFIESSFFFAFIFLTKAYRPLTVNDVAEQTTLSEE